MITRWSAMPVQAVSCTPGAEMAALRPLTCQYIQPYQQRHSKLLYPIQSLSLGLDDCVREVERCDVDGGATVATVHAALWPDLGL